MLRSLSLAAISAAAVAVAAPALAADLPMYEPAPAVAAPSAPSWSGVYLGGQAGYAWGRATNQSGRPNTRPDGGTVGVYAGVNHQFDGSPVVIGAETDINKDWAEDKAGSGKGAIKNELEWSGATRARLGYGAERVLVYGAAGLAYGGHKVTRRAGSDDKTAVGWTVGGGVEAAVAENVTARVDYRYNDYGTDKFNVGGGVKSSLTENRVTGGVAYKFSGW